MATRPDDLIYAVDEWPPWPKLVLLGLQQAILAAVYLVLIVIVARAAGAPTHTAMSMVSLGMIAVALSTSLQALWKGPVGSGYLAVPVFSAIYLAPAILAAKTGGLPAESSSWPAWIVPRTNRPTPSSESSIICR